MAAPQGSPRTHALLWQLVGFAALALVLAAGAQWGLLALGVEHRLAALGSLLLALLLLALAVNALVLRRLARLNDAVRQVSAGDLAQLLPRGTGREIEDEIGQLTAGIEAMLATLRSNVDDLRTNDELRRKLVANVSHELRTPLTSMQGYLDTIRLAGPGHPDWKQDLDVCVRETKKLAMLVKDLFELSKLDTKHLEFHFEVVSLVEIADQVGLAFEQRMADKSITFATSFPDDPLEVWGDGNRLAQVIQNLLANAVHFTPEGGRITLACDQRGPLAVLTVADNGVGISPKDLPHVFESFFHLEKSRTRNLGGTGLGLAICKAIVEAHKGRIAAASVPGEGATFTVELALQAGPVLEGSSRAG